MDTNTLIIGGGEIGSALAEVFKKAGYGVKIYDINSSRCEDMETAVVDVDFMHICFGFEPGKFIPGVLYYIQRFKPKFTIIDSTVPVGTTSDLIIHLAREDIKQHKCPVVHSPVRGRHHDLVNQLKIYTKFVGAHNRAEGAKVAEHYWRAGIPSMYIGEPEVTELGKLLDTTYYGTILAMHQEFARICRDSNVDIIKAFNIWNDTANEGFTKCGTDNLRKPTLSPGAIGGHCVMQNLPLLKRIRKSRLISFIEESDKEWRRDY
jgi:UDP-N-acetyl-D-mannosaminuronate dehydrogenase